MPNNHPLNNYRISGECKEFHDESDIDPKEERKKIEPWLSAIFQCEHLSCLLGNGLTRAIADIAGVESVGMETKKFSIFNDIITKRAQQSAKACDRENYNIEDMLRTANELLSGLLILGDKKADSLRIGIDIALSDIIKKVLETESNIKLKFNDAKNNAEDHLLSFLMSFASRLPSRERLNIFTTNYDRLIEHGCDKAGIRIIDRFIGALTPVFRSSRLNIDMHYNPPGIRGEPRYLEGVARLFKLHGSLDWRVESKDIVRVGIAFGDSAHQFPESPSDSVMIYPNAAKDMETLEYPYAELFRDFAAAICRPNAALVVYGFSFGDDHINRIIRDMLKIPSTHLVIITRSMNSRVNDIIRHHEAQVSFLHGTHFSDLRNIVRYYLPRPAIDPLLARRKKIAENREELEPLPSGFKPMLEPDSKG